MDAKFSIEKLVTDYFDCMYQSDSEKALSVFHPSARITSAIDDQIVEMTAQEFADFVGAQQPSDEEKGEPKRLEIDSIVISGPIAVAQVRDDYIGQSFFDILSLVKGPDGWKIYNKLYHIEGPSQHKADSANETSAR